MKIAVIGAGECYENYYLPVHQVLSEEGIAQITAVVDVKEETGIKIPNGATYIRRAEPNTPLNFLLAEMGIDVVCLAHPNSFHVKDAESAIGIAKVIMEKPYAISHRDVPIVQEMVVSGRLSLSEYYLFGKTVPLHILSGLIPSDSFYFDKLGLLTGDSDELKKNAGRLPDIIGNIRSIHTEVLEGEGTSGHVLNRTHELTTAESGGGMIFDLGIHALSPVTALNYIIGPLTLNSVDVAVCEEHTSHFLNLGYRQGDIAETYAVANFSAGKIPVTFSVGKYILGGPDKGRSQRRLHILGSKGRIDFDMSRGEMAVYEGDSVRPKFVVGVNRVDFPRYYPVIRGAIDALDGKYPELTQAALVAHELVLDSVKRVRDKYGSMKVYKWGAEIDDIHTLLGI